MKKQPMRRRITNDMGVPRLDLGERKEYIPMNPVEKQIIVERTETKIRDNAWQRAMLNPIVGSDKISSEPIWDDMGNLL